jgi:pyrroline-5-carboxylate reductase
MTEETTSPTPFPRVAILGGGVMGGTLINALRATGWPDSAIAVAEKDADRAATLKQLHGIEVDAKVAPVVKGAEVVIIATKPQDVAGLLKETAKALDPAAMVLSVAAALPISFYEKHLPSGVPVVRAMPNTPAIVAQGATAIAGGTHVTEEDYATVQGLLRATGLVVKVPEEAMDAVTAVSGSGPAYFYAVIEALTEAGVAQGLDRILATQLAAQTFVGAAKLLLESGETPQGLRRRVSSPGGTTIAALEAMEHAGLQDVISAGVKAAAARAKEMAADIQQ